MSGLTDARFLYVLNYFQCRGLATDDSLFTWSNLRESSENIKERLDRFLGNWDWLELYPSCKVQNSFTFVSDHSFLLSITNGVNNLVPCLQRLFHFEATWVGVSGCEETIASTWNSPRDLSPVPILVENLHNCGCSLTQRSQSRFGNIKPKLVVKQRELALIYASRSATDSSIPIHELRKDKNLLLEQEELRKQRSRVSWLSVGDHYTEFFH